jgi:hypothetical protein
VKKTVISMIRKAGEKVAMLPVESRCFPGTFNQPQIPATLRKKMKALDSK